MRADIAAIKADILAAAGDMVASRDLTPGNKRFHDARYRLYAIAAKPADAETLQSLSADAEVRAAAADIFPLSCRAGIAEECATARELLARNTLSSDDIYAAYYGDIYKALMDAEMEFLSTLAPRHAYYVGGGAMPVPALLLVLKAGLRVTLVDADAESCALAAALAARLGIADLLRVTQSRAEEADYSAGGLVWIANWVGNKEAIFHRVNQFAGVSHVIARTAAEGTLSFVINDAVDACAVCKSGYDVAHRTARTDGVSLTSLIFKNNARALPARAGRKVDSVLELIGNTPLLRLDPAKTGLKNVEVYAKLEHLNPFGSVKDRTALAMLGPHIGQIAADGKRVLELSSGNAARALQAIAALHGTSLETVSNRIRLPETRKLLQLQGATVTPIGDAPDAYAALNIVDQKARDEADRYFYTDQYRNAANVGTHADNTGREILEDLGRVDYFFGAIGTAGSSVGVARTLKTANPALDISGVVSGTEDFIPGIRHLGEIFDIGPFDEKFYNRMIGCTAQEAIDGVLGLIRRYGVMAGPSSGAACHAALTYLRGIDASLTEKKTAVFLVCDRVEPYLSYLEERRPDLFK